MKIRYLDTTGNRLELGGEIDKSYIIAPGKKVTFAEGAKFQGKFITTQSLYNNEYIPKTIGMTVSGQLSLIAADPPPLLEPDSGEESELDEFDHGLERLDDQYRKLQSQLSTLRKENIQLKACIAEATKETKEEKSQGSKFDPAELPPLNIPPETQKFPIIHFQPFSPDGDLSPGSPVEDSPLRTLSLDFDGSSRSFPSPTPLIRSETVSFASVDTVTSPQDSPSFVVGSLVRSLTMLPEERDQIPELQSTTQSTAVQASQAPEKELERESSASSLVEIIDASGLSATPAGADQTAVNDEQEVDVSGESAYSRDHSFCGFSCPIL